MVTWWQLTTSAGHLACKEMHINEDQVSLKLVGSVADIFPFYSIVVSLTVSWNNYFGESDVGKVLGYEKGTNIFLFPIVHDIILIDFYIN